MGTNAGSHYLHARLNNRLEPQKRKQHNLIPDQGKLTLHRRVEKIVFLSLVLSVFIVC